MTRYDIRPTERFAWLEQRIGRILGVDAIGYEVVDEQGEVVAMAAFEWWSENAVGIHVAADKPLALRHAVPVLRWALSKRETVWGIVENGGRSARLARKLGFMDRGRLPGAGRGGVDLVLLAVTRDEFEKFAERQDHVLWKQPAPVA